ncbi:MAG: hypothetical protein M9898_08775 [Chitinophagaceae bacterium]|nr:hypothetical protein [Chitinophagaceae bacterium]
MKTFIDNTNKCRRWMLLFFIFILPAMVAAQNIVSVNVVLKPPYSSNYSAYENLANRAIITLVGAPRNLDIYLTGSLANSQSDLFIYTSDDFLSSGVTFTLPASQTRVIMNDVSKMRFLARNNVIHQGISEPDWMSILQTDQLPEGQYELCVQAMEKDVSGVPHELGRGCAIFSVTRAQPPIITMPQDGQYLSPQQPNTVFSWTPVIGNTVGANVVYDLYVTKVLNGQNPADAIDGAINYKANNPIIKKNLTSNQYVTQPYDLKIDSNTLYAVAVVAHDLNKKVGFANNGRSEIVTFTKGNPLSITPATTPLEIKTVPKQKTTGFEVTNVDPVPYSQLKGKLYYRFKDDADNFSVTRGLRAEQKGPVKANLIQGFGGTPDLDYNKSGIPVNNAKPLAGKKISLVLTYIFTGSYDGAQLSQTYIPGNSSYLSQINYSLNDADKVLATTTTQSDGSFTFDFVNTEKKLGISNPDFSYNSSGEFSHQVKGVMYKVLRIRVEDNYYCSPEVNIKIDPWKGLDLGTLVSYVKSYTLKVKVKSTTGTFWQMTKGQGAGQSQISTSIIRKGRPGSVPSDEGENEKGPRKLGDQSISTGETDNEGYVVFKHLVRHDPNNKQDKYFIRCTPNLKKGSFIFKQKEKSYYPLYDKDLNGFPFNSIGEYEPQYKPGDFNTGPVKYGEDIVWNSQLEIKTYSTEVELMPERPRIAGMVNAALDNEAKPMSNVKVVIVNDYKKTSDPSKLFTTTKTDKDGHYEFNDLDVEIDDVVFDEKTNKMFTPTVLGPKRTMITKVDGFKAGILPQPPAPPFKPLLWGQQLLNQDFSLYPDGFLSGYVVDETGAPVEADVDIDGYTKVTTKLSSSSTQLLPKVQNQNKGPQPVLLSTAMQRFSIQAPSGKRKITITPTDLAYTVLDTTITISKENEKTSIIKFVVRRSQKRIRFRVSVAPERAAQGKIKVNTGSEKSISGATVKLDIPGKDISQVSDKDGYVVFQFDNSASNFNFIITPPVDGDYEEGSYQLSGVKNTTEIVTYKDAHLKKAAVITGVVTSGEDKQPLKGALVYIELGNKRIESAPTDDAGHYVLKGVPTSPAKKTVWAGKTGMVPNIISQHKEITIGSKNELDFNLITDNDIAIEKIFGFDVEIQSKAKQQDGTWLVSGDLVQLPENDNFSLNDKKQTIPFHDLKIKKGTATKNGVPIGVPVENNLVTDLPSIKLLLQNAFAVVQTPSAGDQLKISTANDKGGLTGKIHIQKSGFSFSKEYVSFNEDKENALLLTDKPGSTNSDLVSITTTSTSKIKYGVLSSDAKALKFKLQGFDVDAEAANSWVQDNTINLRTVLHVTLPGITPLNIEAGDLIIHPDKLESLKGDKPLTLKLEKWEMTASQWQLSGNSNTIGIASGTMKTGSLDVPLSDISIKPDHLDIGSFDVKQISFANIIPVDVLSPKPVFGFNKNVGSDQKAHYELRLMGTETTPGVVLKGLPGMKAGDQMKFQNLSLVSNGEQILQPGNQGNFVTFYDVMKVRPIGITSGANYVDMACGIDFGIPQLEETNGAIQFYKEQGSTKLRLYPVNVSINGSGGVGFYANLQFDDHPQDLTQGNFTAMGTIQDKEGINLKAVLHRTIQEAWIQVEPENQKLPLGGSNTSLADIKGRMQANMTTGTWNYFTFSGAMQGFKGMQGDTRKTFTVTGSINANDQKIDVKNIPSGFGNIGLTYDIPNSRFTGSLQLDKQIGPMYMAGAAELLVDNGGWYFLAGGKLNTPGLGGLSAGLLIGDYKSMPANVSSTLMQFAYDKNVPPSFKNGISGFFFTGMKELPVINIPDYSIDLGVISASFGAKAGLDARLWMDFNQTGNQYGIGAMVFAHAYLKGASVTCTKFGADARAELGMKGIYNSSSGLFSLKGCGSFTIQGSIQQCFPLPCWSDGICCEECIGISKSTGIKIDLSLDSGGNTGLSFGFGNCSGQATMTGNW